MIISFKLFIPRGYPSILLNTAKCILNQVPIFVHAPVNILITELQNQLALMQAKLDVLQEDKVEMQARIDHLLAELKLSKSQKYGKKSEKAPRGTFNETEQHKSTEPPKHHKKGKQTLAAHLALPLIWHIQVSAVH